MAYMAVVVGGDAADVELDLSLLQGDKGGFLTGLGVEDFDTHGLFHCVDMHGMESAREARGGMACPASACFRRTLSFC